MIPITREQAIHGLEEILRKGGSLSSRVDVASGKITWKGNGIAVDGEVTELGDEVRKPSITMEGEATNGVFYEGSLEIK